jgi:hypothetical protein
MNQINQSKLKEIFSYDAETGFFTRLVSTARLAKSGTVVNNKGALGYFQIKVAGKSYLAHRLAWLYVYGEFPKEHIDHINGNPSDNRISNLRDVDRRINMQNKKTKSSNKSGYLGVFPNCGKWIARIRKDGVLMNLGNFSTPDAAHEAYLQKKRAIHPGCTI